MTVAEMTESRFSKRQFAQMEGEREFVPGLTNSTEKFGLKPAFDRLLAVLMLIPALPVIVVLIVVIRLSSRGPGLFRQVRVGKAGRIFTMYKLRSMRLDAEAATGPAWSANARDPRVTRVGYWLRRLHLDELPQLFNVLKGDMSLVGPRPERPEFVHILADQVPSYLDRLVVRPGITGLAQINLPPDTDIESVRRKLALDLDYISTANLWLDLRIVLCTALRMLWIRGPLVTRALGLKRTVYHPAAASRHGDLQPVSLAELTPARHAIEKHRGVPSNA